MRPFVFMLLLLLPVATSAVAPKSLAICREFAELTKTVVMRRDAGITESAQARDWEKVIAQHEEQATKRALMANILHYAYSPDAKAVTAKQARTEYFKGCRASIRSQ
ncbi:MAG: hypothetical protein K2Q12_09670 [Rickettsiales bacterium]|nr:hypothetical protein [Rickettsiales bacterium]